MAYKEEMSKDALLLFTIQFVWQFPHTWSIAWLLNDDYIQAGFRMLPTMKRTKTSAFLIFISAFLVIPSGLLLHMYESAGYHVTGIMALDGTIVLLFAYRFYKHRTTQSAVQLMLSCLVYLPVVLLLLVAEKFLL